jgi:hypothetical protein
MRAVASAIARFYCGLPMFARGAAKAALDPERRFLII